MKMVDLIPLVNEMREQGFLPVDISNRLGCDVWTVRKINRENDTSQWDFGLTTRASNRLVEIFRDGKLGDPSRDLVRDLLLSGKVFFEKVPNLGRLTSLEIHAWAGLQDISDIKEFKSIQALRSKESVSP